MVHRTGQFTARLSSTTYIDYVQSNFYRQIRNFDIDMTLATMEGINGIHWQVAQATSISNVAFYMSDKSSSTQIGICESEFLSTCLLNTK